LVEATSRIAQNAIHAARNLLIGPFLAAAVAREKPGSTNNLYLLVKSIGFPDN